MLTGLILLMVGLAILIDNIITFSDGFGYIIIGVIIILCAFIGKAIIRE